ncbi:reverse transcriptase domain-containing protein [Tanacetum coccineum]
MDVCHALANLGASINLMPLSFWKKLSLPELTPTRMTLELADQSIIHPKGLAEDVYVKVGKFHFPTDFVVVDFEADPRYAPELLGFSNNDYSGGNPTLTSKPFTSEFILEEIEAYLKDDSISPEIDYADCNPDKDICLIEKLLNNDPFQLPPMDLKQSKVTKAKSSIEEPPELELKDLPYHLEYAYLDENDKLPVIIAKGLKHDEKEALLKVLKSHKWAIAWKITNIKGIDPRFCTHKILMEDDYKPTVQSQRWFNPKNSRVNKKGGLKNFLLPYDLSRSLIAHGLGVSPVHVFPRSDRGTQFCNDKFTKVMSKYGVTHRLAIAYYPQTSGQVEVSNRGLKCILERMVGENCASWSDKLDDALWAFRTTFKTPIGCTPYKLVYGKSCHLPIELEHRAYWALKHANFDLKTAGDHRKLQLNELNELRDQAYENSLIYKEKTKKLHDSKIKNRIFNVGDRVLLFNSRLKIFSGKLKTRWSGPFTITKVFPYGTIELSQPDGPNFKVNGHRVKHYFGGDLPPKVWHVESRKHTRNGNFTLNPLLKKHKYSDTRIATLAIRVLMIGTDISKITRKPSKTGKHGHEKRKSTKEARDAKPKPGKIKKVKAECHVVSKKAQGCVGFTLLALTQVTQAVTSKDCQPGNPFVHILDPRAKIDSPMSEIMKGTDYESKESLEASEKSYK